MRLDFPERRSEPFEKWTKVPVCPICGKPEPGELYFYGAKTYSDIAGCDKCITIERDLGEINDILLEA